MTATVPEAIVEGNISVRGRTRACSLPTQHGSSPDSVGGCAKDLSTADCENAALSSHTSEATLPAVSGVNAGGDGHEQAHTDLGLDKQGLIVRAAPTEAYGLQLYHISTTNAAGAATLRLARKSAKASSTWQEDVNSSHRVRAASLEGPSNKQQRRMERKSASVESLHPEPGSSETALAPARHPKKSNHAGQQHSPKKEGRSGKSRRLSSERMRANELLLW